MRSPTVGINQYPSWVEQAGTVGSAQAKTECGLLEKIVAPRRNGHSCRDRIDVRVVVVLEDEAREVRRSRTGVVDLYPIAGCSTAGLYFVDAHSRCRAGVTGGGCDCYRVAEDAPRPYLDRHYAIESRVGW